jgi:hypothetical protein
MGWSSTLQPRSSAPSPVRIETFPLIVGVLVAMLGIGIMFDAWTPDAPLVSQERRRRPRIERHRNGEAMIGIGVLALAAAFIGRDNWRYSILVVIIGAVFLIVGAVLNGRYVRELFVNRGPLRRREEMEPAAEPIAATAVGVDVERPVSQPAPEEPRMGSIWDGSERRKSPRDGGRKPRRDASSDDPIAPNP